jgi:hypothetical protein
VAICGTVLIEAPSAVVAYKLLLRFGLGSEVETHGSNAPIDLRVPFDSDEELHTVLRDLHEAVDELGIASLRVSWGEESAILEGKRGEKEESSARTR